MQSDDYNELLQVARDTLKDVIIQELNPCPTLQQLTLYMSGCEPVQKLAHSAAKSTGIQYTAMIQYCHDTVLTVLP